MSKTKPPVALTPPMSPQQILSQAQKIKEQFAMQKGKADQLVADSASDTINGMLNIIQQLLQRNTQLENELKLSPQTKKIAKHETPDIEGKASGK